MITVAPELFSSATTSSTSANPSGSSWPNGSSRNAIDGFCKSTRANERRKTFSHAGGEGRDGIIRAFGESHACECRLRRRSTEFGDDIEVFLCAQRLVQIRIVGEQR